LLLNPRRKCDLPQDHSRRIQFLQTEKRTSDPYEKEAREITLTLFHPSSPSHSTFNCDLNQKKIAPALLRSARYLGQIIGKKLYLGIVQDLFQVSKAQEIFFAPIASPHPNFESRYLQLSQGLQAISLAGSKRENL
jgi:hypothetical protein